MACLAKIPQPMSLPDQKHIDQVRNALWKRSSRATVMVGSGFSRNAHSIVPGMEDYPPTLHDLTRTLSEELYLQGGHEFDNCKNSNVQYSEFRSFPSLAQEYETAFGRTKLHELLKSLIRDDDLRPTDIHQRLLRLPWRDVFTTNWDTLLEKSLDSIPDRKYSILQNKDQIPLSDEPRIVKLHGSFPAHFPLTCTQEDYRTYPIKFAPFVNTVQQAMMETVFLLIGFSGDDQNFLQWTGWVRDNLGGSAPKIYLAGWLKLSTHRRQMLEQRNVVPIDLAHHPNASKWPVHQHHNYAMQWILHTLEHGRPYRATDWPSPNKRSYPLIPDQLQPVVEINIDEPKEEPWPNSGNHSVTVDEVISIWAHNRKLYPGWLAVPASEQRNMSPIINEWEPRILNALPEFDPVRQLEIIYELNWRREIFLHPISSEFESAAHKILQQIDCSSRTINGESKKDIKWSNVRAKYRAVALALLSAARFRFDDNTFEERFGQLQDFRDDDLNVAHRLDHERCLWAMYSLDYQSLSRLLNDWSPENCDPIWMIRKAALLYEINRVDDADKLATLALSAIRRIPDDDRSVAGPSREGWSLWLVAILKPISAWFRSDQGNSQQSFDQSRFQRRWRELASIKCDALSDIKMYNDSLAPENKKSITPSFDFGTKTIPGFSISNVRNSRHVAAYRAIRLSEIAGLPALHFSTLELAANELSNSEPDLSVRLILRTCGFDRHKLIGRLLSRPRIALIPAESVDKLIRICSDIIKYALPRIGFSGGGGRVGFWPERTRVAMEVLSRLVVRKDPEEVEKIFDQALEYYNNATIIQEQWLHEPVRNMLKRSWNSLPKQRREARLLDLLSAPIFGIGDTAHTHWLYPRPEELFVFEMSLPHRTNDNKDRWQRIISNFVQGLNEGGEARKRSSLWIFKIALWDCLTEDETVMVADALWSEKYLLHSNLPEATSLLEWTFMALPKPQSGRAERGFRDNWLSGDFRREDVQELANSLVQVGAAISNLKPLGRSLTFSETEQHHLINAIRHWLDLPMPNPENPIDQFTDDHPIPSVLNQISNILSEIQIPTDIAEKLYQKMEDLNNIGIPAFCLIPSLLNALPDRFKDLCMTMRLGLKSRKSDLAKGAVVALNDWLKSATESDSDVQSPPDDLVREIGVIIAVRRIENLGFAIEIARRVFDNGTDEQRKTIRDLALHGLKYLAEELRYDREYFEEEDLPLLRWRCVQLAISISKHDPENEPIIVHWLQEVTKTDPLPEIRYAIDTISAYQ